MTGTCFVMEYVSPCGSGIAAPVSLCFVGSGMLFAHVGMHVFAAVPQRKIIELYATLMRQCRIACMTHYITTNVFSAITPEAGTDHCPAHCILQGGKSCCVPCSLLAFKKRQANLKTMPNGNYTSSTYRACKHRASAAAQSHQHPASRLQNQEHPCAYVG